MANSSSTNDELRRDIRDAARGFHHDLVADRAMETEAHVLEIVCELATSPDEPRVSIAEITHRFSERHGEDYERKITPKWIGTMVRRRLGLKAQKREGVFVIPFPELAKLPRPRERYGLDEPSQSDAPATSEVPQA